MQDRIRQGKYINFDRLLLPPLTPPLFTAGQKSTKQRKTEKCQVTDLTSWLEAWNRYATCRIASDSALELVKYQTVVSLLFGIFAVLMVASESDLHAERQLNGTYFHLLGSLIAFAARAVPAGRLFLRRLITLSTKVRHLHHRLRLNKDVRADILWWHSFLPSWNGTAAFLDPETTDTNDLELFTDASGSLGFGAYFRGSWFHYSWQPHQKLFSIQWQELFAIVAAALTWGNKWQKKCIQFNCDNQAIVLAWQGKSSKDQQIMCLLRKLFLTAAQHNFTVFLRHLPGRHNAIADALSRRQF